MTKIAIIAQFPIGVLTEEMMGRGGGHAATWLPQFAKALEESKNYEIHWVILDNTVTTSTLIRKWNQIFHVIPCTGISVGLLLGRWPQRLAYRKIFQKIKPDLIHCWGTETLHGAALSEFQGASILSMQGMITTYFKTGGLAGWRWRLFRYWEPASIRKAKLVTCESQWGLDRVAEIQANTNTRQVEYGVFPSYYDVQWKPHPDAARILFVGSFTRLKGVDILVRMLHDHPSLPWKMVFVGGGALLASLQAVNHPSVEVLGLLKTEAVQEEMSKAWALVMPSRADTSPNAVKEARVIGLPIVASPHGGHAEYVTHKKDGFIVNSENPEDWFKALNSLCENYQLCREMGSTNQDYFRQYFRPEKTAREFLGLYDELCPRSH